MQGRWDRAEGVLTRGLQCATAHIPEVISTESFKHLVFGGEPGTGRPPDSIAMVNLHAMLAHLYLALARTAPKALLPHASQYDPDE